MDNKETMTTFTAKCYIKTNYSNKLKPVRITAEDTLDLKFIKAHMKGFKRYLQEYNLINNKHITEYLITYNKTTFEIEITCLIQRLDLTHTVNIKQTVKPDKTFVSFYIKNTHDKFVNKQIKKQNKWKHSQLTIN